MSCNIMNALHDIKYALDITYKCPQKYVLFDTGSDIIKTSIVQTFYSIR